MLALVGHWWTSVIAKLTPKSRSLIPAVASRNLSIALYLDFSVIHSPINKPGCAKIKPPHKSQNQASSQNLFPLGNWIPNTELTSDWTGVRW